MGLFIRISNNRVTKTRSGGHDNMISNVMTQKTMVGLHYLNCPHCDIKKSKGFLLKGHFNNFQTTLCHRSVCGWNIVWPPSALPTYGAPTHPNDQGAAGTGGTVGGRAPFSCTHQQQCSATELLSICSHELLARNYSVTIRRRVKSFSEYL